MKISGISPVVPRHVNTDTLATYHQATVHGEKQTITVKRSADSYTAAYAGPPPVQATGSTLQAAEARLDFILDLLA